MHSRPGSPKKPCWAMAGDPAGTHQWITLRRKELCWICGARKMEKGNYGE